MSHKPGFAVIDLETTGFGGAHRIIEIGVVLLTGDLEPDGTWETLVQPHRDISNTFVHGITATDVVGAPLFTQVAHDLAATLHGRILVAHNAQFERRFLNMEFRRTDIATDFTSKPWIDTRELSRQFLGVAKLEEALNIAQIRNSAAHSALGDAEATAQLLKYLAANFPVEFQAVPPVSIPDVGSPGGAALVRRGDRERAENLAQPSEWIARLVRTSPDTEETASFGLRRYSALLREALADRRLDAEEMSNLARVAAAEKVSDEDIRDLHEDFLRELSIEAWMDGVITTEERTALERLADQFGVERSLIDQLLMVPGESAAKLGFELKAGDRVAFTGAMNLSRETWEERVRNFGFTVGHLTRSTRILVAANVDSMSGKARKARKYQIPIVSEAQFAQFLWGLPEIGFVSDVDGPDKPEQWEGFEWIGSEHRSGELASAQVAALWIKLHPSRRLAEISTVLTSDTVVDLSNSSAERAGWVWSERFPSMLEATVEDLRDLPGVGDKRLLKLVETVVLAALDTENDNEVDTAFSPDPYDGDIAAVPEWQPESEISHARSELVSLSGWHELCTGRPIDGDFVAAMPHLAAATELRDPISELFAKCVDELNRACAIDERFRLIASRRFFADATLEELGQVFGITRERVRQLESQLLGAFRRDSPLSPVVASALADRIGRIVRKDRFETELPQFARDCGFGTSYGEYFRFVADLWETDGEWLGKRGFHNDAMQQLENLDNGYGAVSVQDFADSMGFSQKDAAEWLSQQRHIVVLPGSSEALRARSNQDRAVGVLSLAGEPLTLDEILQRIGVETPPRSMANAMATDERIVKVSNGTFALQDWGLAQFSTILDWIGERVDQGGGSVKLQQLLDDAPELRISPSSVIAYASGAGYQVTDGVVTRSVAETQVIDDDAQDSRDMYMRDGHWHLLLTVNGDHLRGSGFVVPRGVAGLYQVPVDGAVDVPSRLGPQAVRVNRLKQPSTATIRRFLIDLGTQQGDRVWLRYGTSAGDAQAFDVLPAPREQVGLTGLAYVLDRMGMSPELAGDQAVALAVINAALGLEQDAPRRKAVAIFGHRRQDDLADILRAL